MAVMFFNAELLPKGFDTVSVIVYVPDVLNVWLGFFCDGSVVLNTVPSPKLQFQRVGVSDDVSLNWTKSGAKPELTDEVKLALGASAVTII